MRGRSQRLPAAVTHRKAAWPSVVILALAWSLTVPGQVADAQAIQTGAEPTSRPDPALPASAALVGLGPADLAQVAARNDIPVAALTGSVGPDPAAWLDADGRVFYVEPAPPPTSLQEVEPAESAAPYPYADTFALHSKPGAKRTIYLDFNGHVVSDSAWHESFALAEPTVAVAFDIDGEPGSFTKAEKARIQSIWQRVAEDYSPFNVDVTTEPPGLASLNRSGPADSVYGTRVVITDTPAFCSCAGVAYLGAFDDVGQYRQPAWVFSNSLSDSAKMVAEAASHETGHNLGLLHDGHGGDAYYSGHDPWAPIMGSGYYQPVVQFSAGAYAGATQSQKDLAVIASHGVKKRKDDHSDQKAGSTLLVWKRSGIVASAGDTDVFRFVAPSNGVVSIVVKPAPVSPNLDVVLVARGAAWKVLARSAPVVSKISNDLAAGMGASFDLAVKKGKKYYLTVRGAAYATPSTGYPRYGSIGKYTINVQGIPANAPFAKGTWPG